MTEEEWLSATDPTPMLEFLLNRPGTLWDASARPGPMVWLLRNKVSDRKLRLFAVACCRGSKQLLLRRKLREGVKVAERFAENQTTIAKLTTTHDHYNRLACSLYHCEKERDIRRWAEATAVACATSPTCNVVDTVWHIQRAAHRDPTPHLSRLLHDIFGNPFRPVSLDPAWLTSTVLALANGVYAERAFDRMPILADALQDAGCDNLDILDHCRGPGPHVRGCWVVDLALARI
jgi:hypothetical protein